MKQQTFRTQNKLQKILHAYSGHCWVTRAERFLLVLQYTSVHVRCSNINVRNFSDRLTVTRVERQLHKIDLFT